MRELIYTNSNLAEGLKEGVKECYVNLYKSYYKDLCGYAFKITNNGVYSEEIVQQVFLNIWEKKDKLIINRDVRQYLFRAVHNQAISFLRKNRKINKVDILNVSESDLAFENNNTVNDELEKNISVAIDRIPGKAKHVFQLSRFESKTNKEIAHTLNISIKGVEFHITNALRFLNNELKEYLPIIVSLIGLQLIFLNFLARVEVINYVLILGGV